MTDPIFRLDTIDLAREFGWEVEHLSPIDEFTKADTTVLVQYSSDDAITSLTRSRPNRPDEVFPEDSPGNDERLRVWLAGRAMPTGFGPHADLFRGLKFRYDGSSHWEPQEFLDAVTDPADYAFLHRILELVQATSQQPPMGDYCHLCFGQRPRGGLLVYPFMRRFPPYKFKISDSGQLMIAGCWKSNFGVTGHPGFADLASMLGQDHTGSAPWSPVDGLDPDKLWEVGERVSRAINA